MDNLLESSLPLGFSDMQLQTECSVSEPALTEKRTLQDFLHLKVSPYLTDPAVCISQSSSAVLSKALAGWMWLNKAEQLDIQRQTSLGTLGHLPVEIRRNIWDLLLEQHLSQNRWPGDGHGWPPPLPSGCRGEPGRLLLSTVAMIQETKESPVFFVRGMLQPEEGIRASKDWNLLAVGRYGYDFRPSCFVLRHVSSSIREECNAKILSSDLHFKCPTTMMDFLAQLSVVQYQRVFNLSIKVFSLCECCVLRGREASMAWMKLFELLPPHLRNLRVVLGTKRGAAKPLGWRDKMQPRRLKSVHNKLWFLDALLHRARKSAPRASITMADWNYYPGTQRGHFESVFQKHQSVLT